ncbi:MAG: flagellar motor stator protein MotA [Candidatus Magnetobacterium sp. LHC-1]|uniref:Flagellar motor stator protein MotA n=1 Tax=Candidatus Magnetobacterium casense TaxID=1455061 RepID=A0ABS6RYT7_9BACT|nr:flagellar motor stator protein MotA [Candidatus Magnetobacterium casensis]MBF0608535.1 flagellar motor stator protein MotA [Nitrospirota bacterium]MBV6341806.1 flagellar motor stator protein MotA [Candidatus Magnetobacterium casensis]
MTVAVGIAIVLIAVIGGYLMEHGNLALLINPAEFFIIGGSAFGAFVIATPKKVMFHTFDKLKHIFSEGTAHKEAYLELLSLLFLIFSKVRKEGLISIEQDVEDPSKSAVFTKYKSLFANKTALGFICDNLKVIITTSMPTHELDELLNIDIEANSHEEMLPAMSIQKVADALPGFGIVAAVLGVVLTMGKIDSPPAVLGHSIGAALVGTFLGVLMCYGFVGPIASNLELKAKEEEVYFHVIRVALVAFVGGAAPQMAVESGRRAIPNSERPTFSELEESIRK